MAVNLQDLLRQRDQARSRLESTRSQFEQATIPTTTDDATRYLNERVQGFAPLLEERRNLMSQATQIPASQIQQMIEARQGGQQTASPLTMLNSIFRNQANVREQANLIGDQVDTARGRLGDISRSALEMLGQRQQGLRTLLDQYGGDYNSLLGQIENERQRQEARRAQAAQMAAQAAAMRSAQADQMAGGQFSATAEAAPTQQGGGLLGLAQNAAARIRQSPTLTRLMQSSPSGDLMPVVNLVGNNKPIWEDIGDLINRANSPEGQRNNQEFWRRSRGLLGLR